jgi:M6 family metalloprotease-like protein
MMAQGFTFAQEQARPAPALRSQESWSAASRVEGRVQKIRDLNGVLLGLGAGRTADADRSVASSSGEGAAILRERAMEMQLLIEENPSRALEIAFSNDLADRLRTEYPEAAESIEVRGRWSGGADYLVLDDMEGDHAIHRVRMETDEGWVQVHFAGSEPEGLACGQTLEAEGIRVGGRMAAREASVTAMASTLTCSPTGEQKIAVFLVTFPGVTPPASVTPEMLQNAYFGAGPVSLNKFWQEGSAGKVSATGQVFPWRTLSKAYTCDEYYQLWDEVLKTMDPEVDFRQFNRVFLVFPKPTNCSWAGLANVGCRSLSTADGVVPASVAWLIANYMTTNNNAVMLAAHEGGHNLGLSHAASRDFGTEALGAVNSPGTVSEYGDKFSAMGYWNLGHYSARHRQQLGWLTSNEIVTVQSSGTWQLKPAASTLAGVKALRVARGAGNTTNWVWLEARQPVGAFDSTLRSQVFSGALAHYQDAATGSRTNLLDYTETTASFDDPAKATGVEWADPYSNLKFSVNAAGPDGMSVSVLMGPPPCSTANPMVSLSPTNPTVAAGQPVAYTLSVRNNDSSTCPSATFSVASAAPSGWASVLSAQTLTLSPGQSGSVTITKTAGSTAGTFAVTAALARGASTVTASANCTVTLPSAGTEKPVVTSWPTKPSFAIGEIFTFTIKATKSGLPVYPGNAAIVLMRPNGTSTYRILPLGPDGTVLWSYISASTRDVPGEYTVKTVLTSPVRVEVYSKITILPAP